MLVHTSPQFTSSAVSCSSQLAGENGKTLVFVIGERILAPALEAVAVSFQWIGTQLSNVYHFQVLTGVAAATVGGNQCDGDQCTFDKGIHEQITSMAPLVKGSAGRAILTSFVQPGASLRWFKEAAQEQLTNAFAGDFVDSVGHCYIANLNVMKTLRFLHTDPEVFAKLQMLHQRSYSLYDSQLAFNSNSQNSFIEYSKNAYRALKRVSAWVQGMEDDPSKREENLAKIQNAEQKAREAKVNFLRKYEEHADAFLAKIDALKGDIQATIEAISASNAQVTQALKLVDQLSADRVVLETEKKSMQEEFEAFQKTKQKEHDSRKTEYTGGYTVRVWGWTLWSRSGSRRVVEADFGSAEKYQRYLNLKARANNLDAAIKKGEGDLAGALGKINVKANPEDLKQAAASLSAALIAIKGLETSIATKRSNAQRQLETVEAGTKGSTFDPEFPEDYLEDEQTAIVNAQAAWVQSQQQNAALKTLRLEESRVSGLIADDIREDKSEGLKLIEGTLAEVYSDEAKKKHIKMLPAEKLLEQIDKS
ncbi:MAG: hypothetical protein S4CHLAM2_12810 [Chlamydiales bacterium]|nr:hypothetical protein [Chlamydiales bacterium]